MVAEAQVNSMQKSQLQRKKNSTRSFKRCCHSVNKVVSRYLNFTYTTSRITFGGNYGSRHDFSDVLSQFEFGSANYNNLIRSELNENNVLTFHEKSGYSR